MTIREWIVNYIRTHRDRLLALDYEKATEWFHAPVGWTISGYAYCRESAGSEAWHLGRIAIDNTFHWLFNQVDHCLKAYNRDSPNRVC